MAAAASRHILQQGLPSSGGEVCAMVGLTPSHMHLASSCRKRHSRGQDEHLGDKTNTRHSNQGLTTALGVCAEDTRDSGPTERTTSACLHGYTMRDVHYRWKTGTVDQLAVGITPNLPLHQHQLVGHVLRTKSIVLSTGNYSRLALEFVFERVVGYYILNLYIPVMLLVSLSWGSFFLGSQCTAARAALTITPVLSMSVLMAGIDEVMPPVSYVRAIDVYLVTSFMLVLGGMVQFAVAHFLYRSQEDEAPTNPKGLSLPAKVDKYSKIGYPVFYVFFNLIYWSVYLNADDEIDHLVPYH